MGNPNYRDLFIRIPGNPEEMTVEQLQRLEKHLGEVRVEIRKIQVYLRKLMESKDWSPQVTPLFVEGVPSTKGVGTPGR